MQNNQDIAIKVLVLIKNKSGKVLLLHEKIKKNSNSKLNFVRGTYDRAGEIIMHTAKRECLEEVGINSFESFDLLDIREYYQKGKTRVYYIFSAVTKQKPQAAGKDEQIILNEDISSVKWFTSNEIQLLKEDDFVDTIIFSIARDIKF